MVMYRIIDNISGDCSSKCQKRRGCWPSKDYIFYLYIESGDNKKTALSPDITVLHGA